VTHHFGRYTFFILTFYLLTLSSCFYCMRFGELLVCKNVLLSVEDTEFSCTILLPRRRYCVEVPREVS